MKVIDGHVHLDEKKYPDPAVAAKQLISVMDRAKVSKAILMPDGRGCTSQLVKSASAHYPDRLYAFYMPSVFDKKLTSAGLRRIMRSGNYKGVKLHPRSQGICIDDPSVLRLLKLCETAGIPVFIDCFPYGMLDQRNYPLAFDSIAKSMSSLKLIMGHMGGYRALEAFVVAKSNKNVYLDLSFTPMYFRASSVEIDIRYILKRMPPEKLIFGSDYPHMGMKDTLNYLLKMCRFAGLSSSSVEGIFYANIASILGSSLSR